jgi:hypothetical protein
MALRITAPIRLLIFAGVAFSQACYYPNGATSNDDFPCLSTGGACCPLKWDCLSNGLCANGGDYGMALTHCRNRYHALTRGLQNDTAARISHGEAAAHSSARRTARIRETRLSSNARMGVGAVTEMDLLIAAIRLAPNTSPYPLEVFWPP